MNNRQLGSLGETKAIDYLLNKGFQIITRNFGVKLGEIDIIAIAPNNCLVFVEVKLVKTNRYGTAESKVTPAKLKQINRIAAIYCNDHNLNNRERRVDVIAINGDKISHFENCF